MTDGNEWPSLPLEEWRETCETLHRWTQIVGKITLALTPVVNHWWNVPMRMTSRGLATPLLPDGSGAFDMEFDFAAHLLRIRTSDDERKIPLAPRSVASMHAAIFRELASLGIRPRIWNLPVEIEDPIRFDADEVHRSYDPGPVGRFRRILVLTDAVFEEFRAGFLGKCSPVRFFWGTFDLAVTRFSGRAAPPRDGADSITREAYSHEVSSVGFWPGDRRLPEPSYYSYAAPEPPGFRDASIPGAAWRSDLGGHYLPYETVRTAADPRRTLLDFCRNAYAAAADAGGWDRTALERKAP